MIRRIVLRHSGVIGTLSDVGFSSVVMVVGGGLIIA